MRADTRHGTFAELLAAHPDQAANLNAVRALIAEIDPDAWEGVSLKQANVWWGGGDVAKAGKMTHGYVYASAHIAHVNLGFFQGTSLPDPTHLLQGTGKALRHTRLLHPSDTKNPALRALVIAARDLRRASA